MKHGALGQNTARSRRAELPTESVQQRAEGLSAYLVIVFNPLLDIEHAHVQFP